MSVDIGLIESAAVEGEHMSLRCNGSATGNWAAEEFKWYFVEEAGTKLVSTYITSTRIGTAAEGYVGRTYWMHGPEPEICTMMLTDISVVVDDGAYYCTITPSGGPLPGQSAEKNVDVYGELMHCYIMLWVNHVIVSVFTMVTMVKHIIGENTNYNCLQCRQRSKGCSRNYPRRMRLALMVGVQFVRGNKGVQFVRGE